MMESLKRLDRIIRGDATRPEALRSGTIDVPVGGLSLVLALLGMIYGVCMGLFAVIQSGGERWMQMAATMVKVPLLFFLTLAVTFPSLYVFNALVGSRLTLQSVLRLLVAALSVMLALLASFGTIVAFFSVSTTSYQFMKLLNVVVFALAGFLGLAFLLQTLHRLSLTEEPPPRPLPPLEDELPAPGQFPPPLPGEALLAPRSFSAPGPLERNEGQVMSRHVKVVFRIWVIVFGLVGAQMAWVLRPFIGSPDQPFSFFRTRESNFFEAIMQTLQQLLGGWR